MKEFNPLPFGQIIYGDGSVESEFLGKRRMLKNVLNSHGVPTDGFNFEETYNSQILLVAYIFCKQQK